MGRHYGEMVMEGMRMAAAHRLREVVRFVEGKWEQKQITTDEMIDVFSESVRAAVEQAGARVFNLESAGVVAIDRSIQLIGKRLLEIHPELRREASWFAEGCSPGR